jgi:pimeloyl-ACP methyl ester carboxylesterase
LCGNSIQLPTGLHLGINVNSGELRTELPATRLGGEVPDGRRVRLNRWRGFPDTARMVLMTGMEIELPVRDGVLAGLDFGGHGPGVLLVHGSGHNAAVWAEVAPHLVAHCHVVAPDLRGHGRTTMDSAGPEQYWRDIGDVVESLGWVRPVLVGHSTGGYAVTAATAAALVDPAAVCLVDGVVLDDRVTAVEAQARWREPEAAERLRTLFRYGWTADDDQMHAYVERCVRDAASDWLNAGASPRLVRSATRRSFSQRNGHWIRRPTLEEVATVSGADPTVPVYPSVDLYERIGCPLTIVLASAGFYAERRSEAQAVVDAGRDRRLVDLVSNHNVPMTHPGDLAEIVLDVVRRYAVAPGRG